MSRGLELRLERLRSKVAGKMLDRSLPRFRLGFRARVGDSEGPDVVDPVAPAKVVRVTVGVKKAMAMASV